MSYRPSMTCLLRKSATHWSSGSDHSILVRSFKSLLTLSISKQPARNLNSFLSALAHPPPPVSPLH